MRHKATRVATIAKQQAEQKALRFVDLQSCRHVVAEVIIVWCSVPAQVAEKWLQAPSRFRLCWWGNA